MARNDGVDRTFLRNRDLKDDHIAKAQEHNEREKENYRNMAIVTEQTPHNVHFKIPTGSYAEMFADEKETARSERGGFMITGLTKKEKVTKIHYNAAEPYAEIYTHDTKLKKRLQVYAKEYPKLCKLIKIDKQGGMRFRIDKSPMSIRLTAPYSEERKAAVGAMGRENYKYMNETKEE